MNQHFHCVVRAKPIAMNRPFEPTAVDHAALGTSGRLVEQPFRCSFEEVATNLESLPRMHLELDGSFVWVGERDASRFQLDGLLVDDGTHLRSMELKGACDEAALNQLLTAIGWPAQEVVFELVREGVHLTEAVFRDSFIR